MKKPFNLIDCLEQFSDFLFRRKWKRIRVAIEKHKPEEGPDGMSAEGFYDLACKNETYGTTGRND